MTQLVPVNSMTRLQMGIQQCGSHSKKEEELQQFEGDPSREERKTLESDLDLNPGISHHFIKW